ncbi:MAG: diphthine--ammonia ligase [Candidatus Sulfobium sp.]
MDTERVLFAWSGGKDSAMALHRLKGMGGYEVAALLTTVTEGYDRVSMHGVREVLLERQAASLEIPLEKVLITKDSSDADYESRMSEALGRHREVRTVCFGDIFLEDLRSYREDKLAKAGMKGLFPIWKKDTKLLAREFVELGFRAIITCVDTEVLDPCFAGRYYDESLIDDLPGDVDLCGENGEFHTFVYDGPVFQKAVPFTRGETVLREGRFCFCDLNIV